MNVEKYHKSLTSCENGVKCHFIRYPSGAKSVNVQTHPMTTRHISNKLLKKKFGNSTLTDDFSLVTNSFSLHSVSLESPVIPLYNDVPFVMITQFGDVQHS